MNDDIFFAMVKQSVFGGHFTQNQVDGINNILDYAEQKYPTLLRNQLANILAQVTWETARQMQPISEYGGPRYLRSKPYFPAYGRGLIQITWPENYHKFGIVNYDDALTWPVALDVLFRGMLNGMFSDHKLSEFVNEKQSDFFHARRVVNILDHAHEIAALSVSYLKALEAAGYNPTSA